jgi:epsilon-lactone hydrolase
MEVHLLQCLTTNFYLPMASLESKIVDILLRLIGKKKFLKKQFALGRLDLFAYAEPPKKIVDVCLVEKRQVHDRNVFTLIPKEKKVQKHILYLHGGAYVQNFAKPHWHFLVYLLSRTDCAITAPDYPLAPTNTYRQSFAMVETIYKELISTINLDNFILMGDSAGGGFALALAQKMLMEGIGQPSRIILLSPWLDISLSNPLIGPLDILDPFLGIEGLKLAAQAYAGDTSLDHYQLSPINGPLEGLGKISLFVGTKEILLADSRKLKDLMEDKKIRMNYYEYKDMVHVWMFLNLPESKEARQQILNLIRE